MTRKAILCAVATLLFGALAAKAQNQPVRVIAFGAHPDDCDLKAGGPAAKFTALGHKVKFVSLTNGDAGHQSEGGGQLAMRRRAEAQEAARRIGIEYDVLDNHDGRLLPTLDVREQVIREIRQWKADIVIGPRPNDYHPDHRYTGVLVQDASYMVIVPNIVTDTPALRRNPVFLYYSDRFMRPQPFRADIVFRSMTCTRKRSRCLMLKYRNSTSGSRGRMGGLRRFLKIPWHERRGWRRSPSWSTTAT